MRQTYRIKSTKTVKVLSVTLQGIIAVIISTMLIAIKVLFLENNTAKLSLHLCRLSVVLCNLHMCAMISVSCTYVLIVNVSKEYHYSNKAKQSLQQPCKAQLLPPSERALGCLCTTQAFQPCTGKSSWGRASNPQEDCPSLTDRGRGT